MIGILSNYVNDRIIKLIVIDEMIEVFSIISSYILIGGRYI